MPAVWTSGLKKQPTAPQTDLMSLKCSSGSNNCTAAEMRQRPNPQAKLSQQWMTHRHCADQNVTDIMLPMAGSMPMSV
jgi:hypothetical protein